ELIFLAAPACRRVRLAVEGHVEGDDAKVPCQLFVGKQMAPLPRIRARPVQANQRNALAILLEIDAVHLAADLDVNVAADRRLDVTGHAGIIAHAATLAYCRGNASTSLKYCRLAMKGCRSPSSAASPRLVSASRSCQPGRGIGCQWCAQASDVAR